MEGLLAARVYFDGADPDETLLRSRCTALWEGVEWDAFRPVGTNVLYWHLSPTTGFTNSIELRGWHEAMITYLLAIASPAHPVPASLYHLGWASGGGMVNGGTFLGYTLDVGPDWGGSLFFAHYSFLGFDPRGRRDIYADYFLHNRAHTLVNRAYCMLNPGGYTGYGPNCWGLTASSNPWGYAAHAPVLQRQRDHHSHRGALLHALHPGGIATRAPALLRGVRRPSLDRVRIPRRVPSRTELVLLHHHRDRSTSHRGHDRERPKRPPVGLLHGEPRDPAGVDRDRLRVLDDGGGA